MPRTTPDTNTDHLHDVEEWESRDFGADAAHAKPVSSEDEREMDDAMGLQVISVRLTKQLVAQLKILASEKGLGYQPYLRMVLLDHVKSVSHKKRKSS